MFTRPGEEILLFNSTFNLIRSREMRTISFGDLQGKILEDTSKIREAYLFGFKGFGLTSSLHGPFSNFLFSDLGLNPDDFDLKVTGTWSKTVSDDILWSSLCVLLKIWFDREESETNTQI